jgi:hypothetical protein
MLIGLLTAAATYATIFGFVLPRVSVEPIVSLDANNPYRQVFKVQNQGNLALHGVLYTCKIKGFYLDGTSDPIRIRDDKGRWMQMSPFREDGKNFVTLTSGEIDNANCVWFEEPFPFMLREGREIAVEVSYVPAYFPFRISKQAGFLLKKAADGRFHWIPVAGERSEHPS